MRHRVFGRKLGRTKDERRLLFRNLVGELIAHGRIKTTLARAKAIKPLVDKLVTKAKKATIGQRKGLLAVLPKEAAVILIDIAPQFKNRTSGFTRIIHVGERLGDDAAMVLMEWVEQIQVKNEKLKVKSEEKNPSVTKNTKKISAKPTIAKKKKRGRKT